MPQAVEELATMLKNLEDMYYRAEDEEDKEKLGVTIKNLGEKLEELVKKQFDENDESYRQLLVQLKAGQKEIHRFKEDQQGIGEVFKVLFDIIVKLDAVVFGWK